MLWRVISSSSTPFLVLPSCRLFHGIDVILSCLSFLLSFERCNDTLSSRTSKLGPHPQPPRGDHYFCNQLLLFCLILVVIISKLKKYWTEQLHCAAKARQEECYRENTDDNCNKKGRKKSCVRDVNQDLHFIRRFWNLDHDASGIWLFWAKLIRKEKWKRCWHILGGRCHSRYHHRTSKISFLFFWWTNSND